MPTLRVNGIDIWYDISDGPGPTLVMTHGFAGPTAGWPAVMDEVRAKYRVVLYDVRGHGKTTVPATPDTYNFPQFAADLAALIDALGLDHPYVGGVSMGGMITAQFACDYPGVAKAIVLTDTTAGNQGHAPTADIERQVVTAFERTDHIVEKYGFEELLKRENRYRREGDRYAIYSSYSLDEQDARNLARTVQMTDRGFIFTNRAFRARPDLTSRTPEIDVPVLVSCGEWDLFYPLAQRDHVLMPTSRFATIRGAAHDTLNYTPQLWKQAVFDFIDDVEAARDIRGEVTYGEVTQTA